jgi:hypothetical protein
MTPTVDQLPEMVGNTIRATTWNLHQTETLPASGASGSTQLEKPSGPPGGCTDGYTLPMDSGLLEGYPYGQGFGSRLRLVRGPDGLGDQAKLGFLLAQDPVGQDGSQLRAQLQARFEVDLSV